MRNKNCSDLLVRNFASSLEGIGVYLDLTDFEGYDLICAWVVFYFMTRCTICLWLIITDMRRTKSIRVRNKALKIVLLNKYWPESNFVKDASNDPWRLKTIKNATIYISFNFIEIFRPRCNLDMQFYPRISRSSQVNNY